MPEEFDQGEHSECAATWMTCPAVELGRSNKSENINHSISVSSVILAVITRMYSSRMHTARGVPAPWHCGKVDPLRTDKHQ